MVPFALDDNGRLCHSEEDRAVRFVPESRSIFTGVAPMTTGTKYRLRTLSNAIGRVPGSMSPTISATPDEYESLIVIPESKSVPSTPEMDAVCIRESIVRSSSTRGTDVH